ncbi:MAG TPA: tetratricopeptide repeat protein [Candidatus Acidoferrum sp.]|nr:tetratricopeptide repeat protein [Candidatus Acidoferrum sp.]
MNERTRVALLLAVAMLVYGNSLFNSFTQDDNIYIFNNPIVSSPTVTGFFHSTGFSNVFRPVTFASFALNWAISGQNSFGFHLTDLLLNAVVSLLLYLVLKKLLENVAQGEIIAWVAALLFAVHPIHVEAVAAASNRSEALAAGFVLAAWLLHLRDQPVLALVLYVFALFSKESAVVFVPIVVAGDYARGKLQPIWRYVSFLAIAVLFLGVLWKAQGGRFGEQSVNFLDNPLAHMPQPSMRIPNALHVAWKYIGLLIYPAKLSNDYSYNAITLYAGWKHLLLPVAGSLVVLAVWVWAFLTKRREWFLAGAIFLFAFALTANILIPTGTIMGERLMYLPSIGFCLLVALIWNQLAKRQQMLGWVVLGILVLALGARTMARNRDWHDNMSLFLADVKSVPNSAKIHSNLGGQYLFRGQIDEASREFRTALSIYPDLPDADGYLGVVETIRGNNEEAQRLLEKALTRTLKENPNYVFISVNLAGVLMKQHQEDKALKILDQMIADHPDYSRAWSNRAVIRFGRGEMDGARSDAEMALRTDKDNTQAINLLGLLNAHAPAAPVIQPK